MVVAVRLVEVLTMVTICTMVAFIAAVVVTAERFIWISIFILRPLVFVLDILLLALEFMFIRIIDVLVAITACISATFFAEHPFQWYYDLKDKRGRVAMQLARQAGEPGDPAGRRVPDGGVARDFLGDPHAVHAAVADLARHAADGDDLARADHSVALAGSAAFDRHDRAEHQLHGGQKREQHVPRIRAGGA